MVSALFVLRLSRVILPFSGPTRDQIALVYARDDRGKDGDSPMAVENGVVGDHFASPTNLSNQHFLFQRMNSPHKEISI